MKKDLDKMPTEFEVAQYEEKMRAFAWGFQQDVVTFLRTLHTKDIDINWAIKCILIKQKTIIFDRKERARARAEWARKARKCPDCGEVMFLGKVNHSPTTMIGGGYKTQWVCPKQPNPADPTHPFCGYTELSKRTPSEWLKKLRLTHKTVRTMPHPWLREMNYDFTYDLEENKPEGE